nr:2965_t:CDS:2 [Entrophospora candida]CAG8588094.1 14614_t:CDS:2 [Entrophospora candida]
MPQLKSPKPYHHRHNTSKVIVTLQDGVQIEIPVPTSQEIRDRFFYKKAKCSDLPARPPNKFFIFRTMFQTAIDNYKLQVPVVSGLASEVWAKSTSEVKSVFTMLASIAKSEHSEINPGYVYKPRRKKSCVATTIATDCVTVDDNNNIIVVDNNNNIVDNNGITTFDLISSSLESERISGTTTPILSSPNTPNLPHLSNHYNLYYCPSTSDVATPSPLPSSLEFHHQNNNSQNNHPCHHYQLQLQQPPPSSYSLNNNYYYSTPSSPPPPQQEQSSSSSIIDQFNYLDDLQYAADSIDFETPQFVTTAAADLLYPHYYYHHQYDYTSTPPSPPSITNNTDTATTDFINYSINNNSPTLDYPADYPIFDQKIDNVVYNLLEYDLYQSYQSLDFDEMYNPNMFNYNPNEINYNDNVSSSNNLLLKKNIQPRYNDDDNINTSISKIIIKKEQDNNLKRNNHDLSLKTDF